MLYNIYYYAIKPPHSAHSRSNLCQSFALWFSSLVTAYLLLDNKSGRRESNPRRQPWEGCILPLNYFRICLYFITKKNLYKLLIYLLIKNTYIFNKRETRLVLDLLHAHGYSPLSLRLSRLIPFAIRICSLRSCHPFANPPNCAIGEFLPLSLSIKKPHLWWSFFMERETRLELATSSLARRHSTTELPPHRVTSLVLHKQFFFASVFLLIYIVAYTKKS